MAILPAEEHLFPPPFSSLLTTFKLDLYDSRGFWFAEWHNHFHHCCTLWVALPWAEEDSCLTVHLDLMRHNVPLGSLSEYPSEQQDLDSDGELGRLECQGKAECYHFPEPHSELAPYAYLQLKLIFSDWCPGFRGFQRRSCRRPSCRGFPRGWVCLTQEIRKSHMVPLSYGSRQKNVKNKCQEVSNMG